MSSTLDVPASDSELAGITGCTTRPTRMCIFMNAIQTSGDLNVIGTKVVIKRKEFGLYKDITVKKIGNGEILTV